MICFISAVHDSLPIQVVLFFLKIMNLSRISFVHFIHFAQCMYSDEFNNIYGSFLHFHYILTHRAVEMAKRLKINRHLTYVKIFRFIVR